MQFLRSALSRLAIATTLVGASLAIAPQLVEARQPCGSFTINWGGTVRQEDILKCAVEYNTGARHNDRYYLEIKKSKITDNFKVFEISFPEDFDGKINAEKIRVRVNGKEVALVPSETVWDPTSAPTISNTERTNDIVTNIESAAAANAANDTSNSEGELVFVNGELVFLTPEQLAAQAAMNNSNNPSPTVTPSTPAATPQTTNEPTSHSLFITLAEPLEAESEVEIILDEVRNPSNGGMYLVTAFARSQGAALPSRLGAWFVDVDF
jgi:Protein of unknown function (DUF2808)